ncbi:MAG: MoaD/ThiS family protein [Acidimicrobiales bacterium]
MPRVEFTKAMQRHVEAPASSVPGKTVSAALEAYFADRPAVRSYVLDEQGELRKHITVFLNGTQIADRAGMSDVVGEDDQIHVMQALSGG